MKKTYKELFEIDNLIGALYKVNPSLERTKFGYAYKRFADKNFYPLAKQYNEELAIIRIDNAMEDPNTKEIISDRMNPRGFKFDRKGLKAVITSEAKLETRWNDMEVEVVPFKSSFVPPELMEDEIEMLTGLVI